MDKKVDMKLYLKLKKMSEGKAKWYDLEHDWLPTLGELVVQLIEDNYGLEKLTEEEE